MSRQTDRAALRQDAKIRRAEDTVPARATVRKAKGLTPLSTAQSAGYPESRDQPFRPTGKRYPHSNKRQRARYAAQAAAHAA